MTVLRSKSLIRCRACGYPLIRKAWVPRFEPCGNCGDANHARPGGTPDGIVKSVPSPEEVASWPKDERGLWLPRKGND